MFYIGKRTHLTSHTHTDTALQLCVFRSRRGCRSAREKSHVSFRPQLDLSMWDGDMIVLEALFLASLVRFRRSVSRKHVRPKRSTRKTLFRCRSFISKGQSYKTHWVWRNKERSTRNFHAGTSGIPNTRHEHRPWPQQSQNTAKWPQEPWGREVYISRPPGDTSVTNDRDTGEGDVTD